MTVFEDVLQRIASRVPEARFLSITDTDGIEIARRAVRPDQDADMLATEYTTVLRTVVGMARDHGLGDLRDLQIGTEKMTALLVGITREYYLVALMDPNSVSGRARFNLAMAGLDLEREFA